MAFISHLITIIINRFPRLAAVASALAAALFLWIGFFDPTATADDRLFFRIMTAVFAVFVAFFWWQARHRSHERRHPPTDLSEWTPSLEPSDTMTTVAPEARYFIVDGKVSGSAIHTVVLANRDALWVWHGNTKQARDIVGFIELGHVPPDRIKPKLRVDWIQLRSIMHRGLSTKLNVDMVDETGRPVVRTVDLNPNGVDVFQTLAQRGWPQETITSPPHLRRRDVLTNLWVPISVGILVWAAGDRWLSPPADIIAGVVVAVVGLIALWLGLGIRSKRQALFPSPPARS